MTRFLLPVLAVVILLAFLLQSSHQKTENKVETGVTPTAALPNSMKITSSAFLNEQAIPQKYTCDGENTNPPLLFSDVPDGTKSLALIMDDPDAPVGTFVHWVLYNISAKEKGIGENSVPPSAKQAKNSAGKEGYVGACPPMGTHHYFFKLYALDIMIDEAKDKAELEEKMKGHIVEKTELIGLYSRK